jgi:hypothetical protein
MKDIQILHSINIFPKNRKYDLKAYKKHLHGIDMQIHTIPKPPNQKMHDMGLSDLRKEEFKLFAMEYNHNDNNIPPINDLEYYVNTIEHRNDEYGPGINDIMFLNNLDPTFYAMQMQNPDVLTHAQMKRQVDADKFIGAQRPEVEGLSEIGKFEYIPKTNLPTKTRYQDLIWTYRCKQRPDRSLKKYRAILCINGSRKIQGSDYTEPFAPIVQWSTILMVSTLAAMHNLKREKRFHTSISTSKTKRRHIYLRFPSEFEHLNEEWAIKLKLNLYVLGQASRN